MVQVPYYRGWRNLLRLLIRISLCLLLLRMSHFPLSIYKIICYTQEKQRLFSTSVITFIIDTIFADFQAIPYTSFALPRYLS